MTLPVRKGGEMARADAKRRRRGRRESHARREAAWFYKALGGRVPNEGAASPEVRGAAAQIDAWLKSVAAFHRGALSLRYRRREWPGAIVSEFGELSSLAVRLECAAHPATGKTNRELEQAAVERIKRAIEARNAQIEAIEKAAAAQKANWSEPMPDSTLPAEVDLERLDYRAYRHVALAIRALGKVRGDAPCVLPQAKPRANKSATPVAERPPSSSVSLTAPDVQAPSSSVQLVASPAGPSPAVGSETEDAPSSREGRTWH